VVLCDESGHQVVSVSPAAVRCGVREGDSRWEAQRRCAGVVIAQPSPEKYEHFWRQVLEICGDYAPEVRTGVDYQASFDLTGTERLFGPPKRVAQEIRNRLHVEMGLSASVGIGPNRTVARLACELTRPGEVAEVLPEEAGEFLGRLPVSAGGAGDRMGGRACKTAAGGGREGAWGVGEEAVGDRAGARS
jgi:DNA polymerase-4